MKSKGIFAADIDNTLTDSRHLIPDPVVEYLRRLHKGGWEIVFLTGRTFAFAQKSIDKFDFPFHVGLQNGAEVIQMPERKVVFQNFLPHKILTDLDKMCKDHSIGYIVYSGYEAGDFCFYEPHLFSEAMLEYFEKLKQLSSVPWVAVKNHKEIPEVGFPLVKGFGERKVLCEMRDRLLRTKELDVYVIGDVIDPAKGLLLITNKGANKGDALRKICQMRGWNYPIVAAGDDENDIPLLEMADFSICVKGGSDRLIEYADVVAPSSPQLGIIQGMNQILEEHFS